MKKTLLLASFGLATIFFAASCSKDDSNTSNPNNATVQGTWSGTAQYGTTAGNPTYAFTITFKANGTVDIIGNNSAAIDNATGTWAMVQDSVRATYTYFSSSATYTLSGKFSSTSNVMAGTIGLGSSTTGVGLFTVARQ